MKEIIEFSLIGWFGLTCLAWSIDNIKYKLLVRRRNKKEN